MDEPPPTEPAGTPEAAADAKKKAIFGLLLVALLFGMMVYRKVTDSLAEERRARDSERIRRDTEPR